MSNLDTEIIGIKNEIKNLKISQAKQASILRTARTYFNVDFELSWNSSLNAPVSDWLVFDIESPSDKLPLLCLNVEQDDLDNRKISQFFNVWSSIVPPIRKWFRLQVHMVSENADDIAATQGGGTTTVPISFSIVGTDEFTITQVQ